MNKPMILTENLTRNFGELTAVDRLSVEIPAGEVFGLLGPNGAGKTTSIRMLSSLIAPTGGNAQVAGYTVGEEDYDIRKHVGILTESPGMYHQLSAERNLQFFAELYEVDFIPVQVEKYLRMLGLWDRRTESVGTFSKGMRQKLAIARTLLHEPDVLFLDEPTSGLDPQAAKLVREFIENLKEEGRTIIICTHNLDEADRLCDRIAVFKSRLLALDTPANLRKKMFGRSVVFHLYQASSEWRDSIAELEGVQDVQIIDNKIVVSLDEPDIRNPEIIRTLVNAGADIQFVGELRRSLEDVYLQLMEQSEQLSTGANNA